MKYVKIIGLVVLLMSVYSFAEIDVKIGGGLNLSNESYRGDRDLSDLYDIKMHVGFNAGANAAIFFTEHMGVIAGLCYETRGANMEPTKAVEELGAIFSPDMKYSVSYLQIPALFAYRPIPALTVALGPELGIFLGGTMKIGDTSRDMDFIRAVDFGMSLTADYTIADMIAVGAGYYFGFLNNEDAEASPTFGLKNGITNNNLKLTVAYVLHL